MAWYDIGDDFWAQQGDFGSDGLGSLDFNNLEGFDFSSMPDPLTDEQFNSLLDYGDVPDYGVQDLGAQMPTSGPYVQGGDPFSSGWQTSGSDRVFLNDDGSGIGYGTETDTSYGLTADDVRNMLQNGQLNTFESGYNTATGGSQIAPGGGTRIVDQNGRVSYRMPNGQVISETATGALTRPTGTPGGANGAKPAEAGKGFNWQALLPLLLMAMASRNGGGSGSSTAIPKFTVDRKQTPYGSEQFPAGRRPGANAQRYFEPVQYKASGGIAQLAAGGQAFGGVQSGAQPASRAPLSLNQRIQQDFARLSQQNSQDALYRYLASTGYTPQQLAAAMPEYGAADLAREMTKARNMFAGFSPGQGTTLDRNDQGQLVTNALRVGKAAYDYVPSVNPNAAVTVPAPAPAMDAVAGGTPGFDETGGFVQPGINGLSALVQQTDYASDPNRRPGSGGLFFKPVEYQNMAAGGGVGTLMARGGPPSRPVRGPGDGTSDDVPAQIHSQDGGQSPAAIADGEFILDARTVAEIGNGSTEAGARKLEEFVNRVHAERKRAQRGKPSKADALLNKVG